jgi:hypothetical protein
MRWFVRLVAMLGALGVISVMLWAAALPAQINDADDVPTPPADTVGTVRHYLRFGVLGGRGGGWTERTFQDPARLDLKPGDVLLCRGAGSVHGFWSHVTIYLGEGRVLAHDIGTGLWVAPLAGLGWYGRIRVLRPEGDGRAAAAAATALAGRPFNLITHAGDPWQQTCAKATVDAWAAAGVRIADGRSFLCPDAIADGPSPVAAELGARRRP